MQAIMSNLFLVISITSVYFVRNYVMMAKLLTIECENKLKLDLFGGFKYQVFA